MRKADKRTLNPTPQDIAELIREVEDTLAFERLKFEAGL